MNVDGLPLKLYFNMEGTKVEISNQTLQHLIKAVGDMMATEDDTGCDGGLTVADKASMSDVEKIVGQIKDDLRLAECVGKGGVASARISENNGS